MQLAPAAGVQGVLRSPGPAGLCRAYGIPHQRVLQLGDLPTALRSAWGLNRHSGKPLSRAC